jgi:SagB-type dehydrogenase family enzyme
MTLPASGDEEHVLRRIEERRTHRRYGSEPVSVASLGRLLASLRTVAINGKLKYAYGSAGSSYAVQTYLYVKPGRVEAVAPGTWYYDPVEHLLSSIDLAARFGADIHYFENRAIFESSAFSIYLIGRMDAIAPLYGEKSRDFALIEAGLMTELLELDAPAADLGLCQIGDFQFAKVRGALLLGPNDILLHSLIGGPLPK